MNREQIDANDGNYNWVKDALVSVVFTTNILILSRIVLFPISMVCSRGTEPHIKMRPKRWLHIQHNHN
jgi:hypothetical protein